MKIREKWIFPCVVILNLIPVFFGKFFPTMDGAAHLYNSNLINQLLFESNIHLKTFFVFNEVPVPNWTGHVILMIFNKLLPAFVAEKILIVFYLVALPYSFRGLIKTIDSKSILFSYFIFPFTYSFLFLLGFYNFSLAIVFMLVALQYWIKHEKTINIEKGLVLSLFFLLIFFSHIFVFAISIILIGFEIIFKATVQSINAPNRFRANVIDIFKKVVFITVASFIPLLLSIYYFYTHPPTGDNNFIIKKELISWLINIRPIITYNPVFEGIFTKIIFTTLILLFIVAMYSRINKILKCAANSSKLKIYEVVKENIFVSDFLLFSATIILFLYFYLPDSDGQVGFVSARLGLLFFITLILWLSAQQFSKWILLFSVGAVLFCNFMLIRYRSSVLWKLNKIAVDCNSASNFIATNSIVLPLNYSENWLVGHFSNYLGIDKPMIILENYECVAGYFPLKWNKKMMPNTLFGNMSIDQVSCIQWKSNNQNSKAIIDYIFVLGNIDRPDPCNQIVKNLINENYNLVYKNENCQLFEVKNRLSLRDKIPKIS